MFVRAYMVTLIAFTGIDAIWLIAVARPMFASHLGDWLLDEPQWVASAAFYIIYAFALTVLAIEPGNPAQRRTTAMAKGALLGFAAYATFDLSCLAVLKRYSVGLAITDIGWGTVVSGIAAGLGWAASGRLRSRDGAQAEQS